MRYHLPSIKHRIILIASLRHWEVAELAFRYPLSWLEGQYRSVRDVQEKIAIHEIPGRQGINPDLGEAQWLRQELHDRDNFQRR